MPAPPDLGSLDREAALTRVGGDGTLLKEIAVLFLQHYGGWIGELREAAAHGDTKRIERTAHNLKGSVATFGAGNAVQAALNLEHRARTSDLIGVSASLAALEIALETLRHDLESL
jgi:two-component system sensor histidine kinase/response regulator